MGAGAHERMAAGTGVLVFLVTLVMIIVRVTSGLVRVAKSEGRNTGAEGKDAPGLGIIYSKQESIVGA